MIDFVLLLGLVYFSGGLASLLVRWKELNSMIDAIRIAAERDLGKHFADMILPRSTGLDKFAARATLFLAWPTFLSADLAVSPDNLRITSDGISYKVEIVNKSVDKQG